MMSKYLVITMQMLKLWEMTADGESLTLFF